MSDLAPDGTPGTQQLETTTLEGNVDVSSGGTTRIGAIIASEARVTEVRTDSSNQDYDFNVELDGSDVFSAEQSPSNAEESFSPDQNTTVGGAGSTEVQVDISDTGTGSGDFAVQLEYRP